MLFGISHRGQVIILIILIVCAFAFLAKVDYVVGEREWLKDDPIYIPGLDIYVSQNWFFMWVVGYPLFACSVGLGYLLAANDTERNMWYALGLALTVVLFAVGQLEDFFWHPVNNLPFPEGDWTAWGWTAENNLCWKLFGTWNTPMHLIWLSLFLAIVAVMWVLIFTRA